MDFHACMTHAPQACRHACKKCGRSLGSSVKMCVGAFRNTHVHATLFNLFLKTISFTTLMASNNFELFSIFVAAFFTRNVGR
jgi:hypothetical protein